MSEAFERAVELRQDAEDPTGAYVLHFGTTTHIPGLSCECHPLSLTYHQIWAYTLAELTHLIEQYITEH